MKVGSIVIKTDIDNSEFDKKYEKLKTRLKNAEINLEIKENDLENAKREMLEIQEEYSKMIQKQKELNSEVDKMQGKYDYYLSKINTGDALTSEEYQRFGTIENKLTRLKDEQAELNNQVDKYNQKYNKSIDLLDKAQAKYDIQKNKVDEIRNEYKALNEEQSKNVITIDGIGKSVKGITKKVIGWAAAMFGIRTAYMGIRSAMNLIANEDAQFKADLDYIKNAFLRIFEPAARRIVDLIKQLMYYVAYITKMWTGKNIFENANKNLKSANTNAKKLKNTLASFDEMNILSDTSGGDSGGVTPSLDLTDVDNMEVPSWIDWIAKNKDIVISALAGITAGLIAMKLFGLDPIETSGVILFIGGLVYAIKGLLEYLEDPSWENFGKVIEGIGLAVIGLGILFFGLPVIIAGVIILIIGLLIKYWDKIKKWINDKIFGWLNEKINEFREKGYWGNVLADILTGIKMIIYEITHSFDGLFTGLKQMFDGFIKIFSGDVAGGLVLIFKGALNTIIGLVNGFISLVNMMLEPLRWILDLGGELFGFKNVGTKFRIPMLPKLRKGTILNNPGKGVPVASGSAIAGEAGREAYLPLSDEQLLEELGSSIGRHVVVNLTNINKMNGRVLNRETKKVRSEDNFAYNG